MQTYLVENDDLGPPAEATGERDELALALTEGLASGTNLGLERQLVSTWRRRAVTRH